MRKFLFSIFPSTALFLIILVVLLEITCRIFIVSTMHVEPSKMIYRYYPDLSLLDKIGHDKGSYDILFLGGSTIATTFMNNGGVEKVLLDELNNATGQNIRIFNLATPAHTSLDSYYKYKHLFNRKFDLVLVYDGINDVRANNCPPGIYREDYSHYSWYEDLDLLDSHPELKFLAFPYLMHKLFIKIWKQCHHVGYVPEVWPKKEWVQYGADIKTRVSFKNNLERILDIAKQKNEKILLMTFAYYVPGNYSFDKFIRNQLDYTPLPYSAPVEEWGDPDNVIEGIKVQNEVLREIAGRHKEALFVDQAQLMPKSGVYFKDICHFTPRGNIKFVDNLSYLIINDIDSRFKLGYDAGWK